MNARLPCLVFVASLAAGAPLNAQETLGGVEIREEKISVVVLDLASVGVDEDVAEILTGTVADALSEHESVDVIAQDDIRRMVELEAEKQLAGCESDSCLAEIAGALGASFVVYGRVGRLGERYFAQLNVFDSKSARAAARDEVEAARPEELRDALRDALGPLLVEAGIVAAESVATDQSATSMEEERAGNGLLLWSGVALAGAGVVGAVAAGGTAAFFEAALADVDTTRETKNVAVDVGPWLLVGTGVGGAVALTGLGLSAAGLVLE